MHKPVILLTKANFRLQALDRVYKFMKDYENKVFSWFVIGGGWHNTFAPKLNEWEEFVEKHIIIPNGEKNQKNLDSTVFEAKLQQSWRDMGMKGKNPRFIHFDLPPDGNFYDVIPLKDCLQKVSSWIISKEEIKKNHEKDLERWKEDPDMIKYLKKNYKKLLRGDFTDDRNVYNIDLYEPEKIPENFTDYYAVMVDMHM